MRANRVAISALLFCVTAIPLDLRGQTGADSARSSLGLRASYFQPLGDWRNSPVSSSVNLFDASIAFEGDLDFRIANRWTLGVEGGYSPLNGSAWEEYALKKGDTISVSGSFVHFAILIRPHIMVGGPDVIRFEVGPALLLAHGEETYGRRTYPYDFLGEVSFGVQGGVEYMRIFNDGLAASLKMSGLFFPSVVKYIGGATRSAIILPVSVGIRFLL